MKNLIIISIIVGGLIFLPGKAFAAQAEKLTNAELDQVTAGNFLEMIDQLVEQIVEQSVVLADASTLVNINELNSSTLVQSRFNVPSNVEEDLGGIVNINSAEVTNKVGNATNILNISDFAQTSLQALVNINAVNSATVVQSNFNFNVGSVTSINEATVTNTR